ncbi:hypothetical protein TNCV_1057581 [Trichonephila clavipes]|nr:hypothetical protein TNCV_1057581 [Trichonephila clavipes]
MLLQSRVLVWNEGMMSHKKAIEALNQTIQDLRDSTYIMERTVVLLAAADQHPVRQRKKCLISRMITSKSYMIFEFVFHTVWSICSPETPVIGCKNLFPLSLICQSISIESMRVGMPVCHDACLDHQTFFLIVVFFGKDRRPILSPSLPSDENVLKAQSRLNCDSSLKRTPPNHLLVRTCALGTS